MKLYLLFACVVAASAHMCMISPPQRGSLSGINKSASPNCIRLTAPCGKPVTSPIISIKSGQNFTVTLQKNLNHWVSSSPGYFTVGVASSAFENYKELARIPDNGEAALTLYTTNVNIPMSMRGQAIIQAQYVTKNPNAPAIFYQCSDVNIN